MAVKVLMLATWENKYRNIANSKPETFAQR